MEARHAVLALMAQRYGQIKLVVTTALTNMCRRWVLRVEHAHLALNRMITPQIGDPYGAKVHKLSREQTVSVV